MSPTQILTLSIFGIPLTLLAVYVLAKTITYGVLKTMEQHKQVKKGPQNGV